MLGSGALMLAVPGAASAHPLGNFTVNRYSGLVVSTDAVRVDHVRDLAEIPTAQRSPAIDTSGDDRLSAAELAAWAGGECRRAARGLRLDGRRAARCRWQWRRAGAVAREGQAGLPTLRLECSPAGAGLPLGRYHSRAAGRRVGRR